MAKTKSSQKKKLPPVQKKSRPKKLPAKKSRPKKLSVKKSPVKSSPKTALAIVKQTASPAQVAAAPIGGRPPLELNEEFIEESIKKLSGNVSAVAQVFGVHRHTLQSRIDGSPRLKLVLDDARETMLDNIESKLYSNALAGNETSIIFFLKTQGKKRGYVERQEMTGAEGVPLYEEVADILNQVYEHRQSQSAETSDLD